MAAGVWADKGNANVRELRVFVFFAFGLVLWF